MDHLVGQSNFTVGRKPEKDFWSKRQFVEFVKSFFSGSMKAFLEWSEFVQIYKELRVSCIATASMRLGQGEFSSDDRARFDFVRTKLPVLIG